MASRRRREDRQDLEAQARHPGQHFGPFDGCGDDGAADQEFRRRDVFPGAHESNFSRYFTEAGFEVAAMEGIDVPFKDVGKLSGEEIYKHTKKLSQHAGADAIYMLGSGWRLLKIVRLLEQDLQVPVVYALGAKLWQCRSGFTCANPSKAYGRLLEELP
jgi:hypothetical protein